MAAAQKDVIIEQGSTFIELWHILDIDLVAAGATAQAKFRPSHASGTTVLTLSTANGTLTLAKSGNHTHATANVADETTALLTAPSGGVYDLEYTISGVVTRAFEGSYYVTPEATK